MSISQSTKNLSSREKLLRAASSLFADKGFHSTSTRDVAKRARVNETTIFRLFKSKRDLYVSVLEREMGASDVDWLQPMLQSSRDDHEFFVSLASRLQSLLSPEFVRLVFFAALEQPELLRKHLRTRTSRFYEVLGRHIQQRIESGILKNLDPNLMGRAFVAMIAYDVAFMELIGGREARDPSDVARIYTDLWLRGALSTGEYGIEEAPAPPRDVVAEPASGRMPAKSAEADRPEKPKTFRPHPAMK